MVLIDSNQQQPPPPSTSTSTSTSSSPCGYINLDQSKVLSLPSNDDGNNNCGITMKSVNCSTTRSICKAQLNCPPSPSSYNSINWIVNRLLKVTICFILIPIIIEPSSFLVQSKRILPVRGGGAQYRTATACENSILEIVCEKDTHINLIRANFGRFSIQTCNEHGSQEMKVDCMSPISFRVMEESCGMKQSCVIAATSAYFGDPCPETPKYLEAHYQCLPDNQKKRYRWQSTTPRSKLPLKPLSSSSLPSSSLSSSSSSSPVPSTSPTPLPPPTLSSPSPSSSELLKPDSIESNHVHPNASNFENNSMKNGLTHLNSGYSVAAGTSTRINNNNNNDEADDNSNSTLSKTYLDTTSSATKSGAKNNSIELRLQSPSTGSSSSSIAASSSTLSPVSSGKSTVLITSSISSKGLIPTLATTTTPAHQQSSTLSPKGSVNNFLASSQAPLTIVNKVTNGNDFDDRPIYIKHPHPGGSSGPEISIIPSNPLDSTSAQSKSELSSPFLSSYQKGQSVNSGSSSSSFSSMNPSTGGESDYANAYESSSSSAPTNIGNPELDKSDKGSNGDSEYEEASIFIRHPHPGMIRDPSLSSSSSSTIKSSHSPLPPPPPPPSTGYDDQWVKIDPGSMMINETTTNQLSTDSWLSSNLSSSNLVTGIIFALGAALSAVGVFFYLYLRDANIKSRFWSLASALNGKIICSRNIGPMEPGTSLKDDVATLRKRGGHLISVTPTSKYMSSENAAHYIRDPIIGPGSGSTLNVITPLGVKYLLPGNGNSPLGASVKDLTYGCAQLMDTLTPPPPTTTHHQQQQQFQLHQQQQQQQLINHSSLTSNRGQGLLGVSLHHQHTHGHHHLRSTTNSAGLPLPIGLVVEHVYECIDDDPYTAKLFMPVDCESNKYQRRDNSIYNGGDFMLPINNHHHQQQQQLQQIQHHHQQMQQQQQMQMQLQLQLQQQSTDLTTTLQALPAIVQENVSTVGGSGGAQVTMNNPQSNIPQTNNSHPHYQLGFSCYPCQSQVASYINKDRIDQQLRENLSPTINSLDSRRPEIV